MTDRLHKSIYGQTLDEMKEDKGAWEYEQDKPKNTLDDLWKNIKKWEIESHIDTLRNIIKVSDRSDCGIKEIDGTDEEAIMFAINALEQIAEQEPYICNTCKHKDDGWDTEPCDGCCGNHSGYEPNGDLISRQAVLKQLKGCLTGGETEYNYVKIHIDSIPSVKQEPMRDATPEERESVDKYVKSISKPTGVDFWDLEQEPCGDAISRQAVRNAVEIEDIEPQERSDKE